MFQHSKQWEKVLVSEGMLNLILYTIEILGIGRNFSGELRLCMYVCVEQSMHSKGIVNATELDTQWINIMENDHPVSWYKGTRHVENARGVCFPSAMFENGNWKNLTENYIRIFNLKHRA